MSHAEVRCISSSIGASPRKGLLAIMAILCAIVLLISIFKNGDLDDTYLNPSNLFDGSNGTRGNNLQTEHFNLSFEGQIENMVSTEGDTLEEVFVEATQFLDFIVPDRTMVNISTDPNILPPQTLDLSYFGYVVPSDMSSSGAPEMFLGLPPEWSTQSNDNYLDMRVWIAAHEFVHIIRYYQTEDYNGSLYPPWLEEGLPTYFAFQHLSASDEYVRYWVKGLIDTNELIDITDLFQWNYYSLGEGYTIIKYIIDEYGREVFLDFLETFKDWDGTRTTDDNLQIVFSSVFDKSLQDFNTEWKAYLSNNFAIDFDRDAIERLPGEPVLGASGWNMPTSTGNGKLLSVTDRLGSLDLILSNEDGSEETWITTDSSYDGDGKLDDTASWIAFTSTRGGDYDIYKVTADGGVPIQLTNDGSFDIMGSWSADGQEIAFTTNRNGDWDIYVMANDGSSIRALIATEANEGSPTFSPEGSRIVYVSDAEGNRDLYIADADGSNIKQLTSTPDDESFPSWSPDGSKIVYTLKSEFSRELFVFDIATGEVDVLFDQPSRAGFVGPMIGVLRYPVWSSQDDAIFIAYGGQIFALELPSDLNQRIELIYPFIISVVVVAVVAVLVFYMRRRRTSEPQQ
ncbi:MAG: hypothetical protein E3J35_09210 [Methanomassiliicoccales archaeon]|nr:MAG: hypothetical protein E3J35_09210 [Methanomassiliicoccales archaeon]